MTSKTKSVLLQILLAVALVSAGALLALLGVRPPCCDPKAGPSVACPPGSPGQTTGQAAATGQTFQGR
ncbi:MAG: hypothetical protein HY900_20100 [Deltaproteobacteria bacterium]|nr:hypothetical protein [Deltaproteobacteria bacterium]